MGVHCLAVIDDPPLSCHSVADLGPICENRQSTWDWRNVEGEVQEPLNLTALSVDSQPEAAGSGAAAPEARGAGAAPEGRRPGPPARPLRPAGGGAAPQPAAGRLGPAQGPAPGRPVCLPDPRQPAVQSCLRDHPGHF